jgi:hypothetical protein
LSKFPKIEGLEYLEVQNSLDCKGKDCQFEKDKKVMAFGRTLKEFIVKGEDDSKHQ